MCFCFTVHWTRLRSFSVLRLSGATPTQRQEFFSSLHLYYIPCFGYCQHILLTFLIFYIKFIFYRAFFASSADMPQAERKNPFEAKNFSFAAADAPQARLTAGAQDIKRRAAAVIGRFCTPLKICVNCFRQAVFLLTISGNAGKINT